MTEDELKKHSAGAYEFSYNSTVVPLDYALDAIKAEREACAKVCESQETDPRNTACPSATQGFWPDQVAHRCAEAIRNRK